MFTDFMSWSKAMATCREHNADLASISKIAENEFVKSMCAEGEGRTDLWLGLNDLAVEGALKTLLYSCFLKSCFKIH